MPRRFQVTGSRVEQIDPHEQMCRAKYLRMRQLPGTNIVVTDLGLYPIRGSAGLRAAADVALVAELEASFGELSK